MTERRILWQLFPSYLAITLVSMVAAIFYAYFIISDIYLKVKSSDLKARAHLIENRLDSYIHSGRTAELDSLCDVLAAKSSTRVTVILRDGTVIADSEQDPGVMDNHANRPEILTAITGTPGTATRYSKTLKKELMYVAIPVIENGETVAIVRASVAITFIQQTLETIQYRFIIAGILISIIVALISLYVSGRISRPLEEMKNGVERFARGELTYRLGKPTSKEMAKLTEALNQMAAQLDDKIRTIIEQKNEQEAVLESMVESVVAVDHDRKIINMNRAAAELFRIDSSEAMNRGINEIILNEDLIKLIEETLTASHPVEEEIVLREENKHYLQVHGTVLKNAQGQTIGAVVVLNDMTRIRRLEKVRRDFVANVSHEIRTPLTSIKGFAETLLDGAIFDPETAKGFVKIIDKQSNRLNAIIEDLLILARLEQEDDRAQLEFSEFDLERVLNSALQVCTPSAQEKHISLQLESPDDLRIKINPDLIEQAVVNLIDNAIKYSPENSHVDILAIRKNGEVCINVRDHGAGIHRKHLPRLFERFYRVDKARSRNLGGTGLGLAIVKHIAQVHGGRVEVESEPGKGSSFYIYIPLN